MINFILRYLALFVILILLQVLILNNIQLTTLGLNPYLYVLFILLLPFSTPHWLLLVLGFALGFSIDIFTDSLGVHSFACVLMAFARPTVLRLLGSRDGYEPGTSPRIERYGLSWFTRYAFFLVLIHHLAFFYMEAFRFKNFFRTFWLVILSTIFTLIIILISQYITYKKEASRR